MPPAICLTIPCISIFSRAALIVGIVSPDLMLMTLICILLLLANSDAIFFSLSLSSGNSWRSIPFFFAFNSWFP